jgi:hypothetical protein
MSKSSKIRRDGRRSFCSSDDPNDICPYKAEGHLRRTWLSGWYDEKDFHDKCEQEKELLENDQ